MTASAVTAGRWELLRALGAVADDPAAARAVAPSLGLEPVGGAEHTDAFVLNLPPYASVYLGPDGALGGEGADRAAGFWRAIGITPPAEPDHLSALLGLYASLGEARVAARRPATVAALARSQASLFCEHLWPWLPAYLDAVQDLAGPALASWADLTRRVIAAEFTAQPACPQLPLALRHAPPDPQPGLSLGELLSFLTTPVRSGMILTRNRLALGASYAGVGYRIGERRYTLRAMLGQDPTATSTWIAREAFRWHHRHNGRVPGDDVTGWWASRAARTGQFLQGCSAAAAAPAWMTP
ncbi:MAG: TorD/DmsD family molecular chaperone [Streptosporangiaceae bacterium]